jgi:cyclic pyranopterin monophosphate synthase
MTKKKTKLSHVSDSGRPQMVDISDKQMTLRRASAEAFVRFPQAVAKQLRAAGMRGKKGPILDTAIVAGVMAAKRTHELIPFCHPLAIERCDIDAQFIDDVELRIRCDTAITGKTGVEMEALTGVTVAALTVYDMCKALSHEIVIGQIRLVEKTGGKRVVRKGRGAS